VSKVERENRAEVLFSNLLRARSAGFSGSPLFADIPVCDREKHEAFRAVNVKKGPKKVLPPKAR
jgi:hypothetical protein